MTIQADAISLPFADKLFDLTFGSPPYCDARTYGIGAQRDCQPWIDWMLDVTTECLRVTKGPVVWVAAGVTRDRNYWPACEGLMYEWWKRGGSMYRPCYWHRFGIPGSGGDQWFRADVEYAMCFKRAGPLPWADNTACGHKPKWGPGGEMSHRLSDGTKVNQWGRVGGPRGMGNVSPDGNAENAYRPSHRLSKIEKAALGGKLHTKRDAGSQANGEALREQCYLPPVLANPGCLIDTGAVGGGQLGDDLAHVNEAPFPEKLAERFILSLCPPKGKVLDPFSGSGTTKVVADRLGRIGVGSDIRMSQCQLTRTRWASDTKVMFA